jgi:hypothetical protein
MKRRSIGALVLSDAPGDAGEAVGESDGGLVVAGP